MPLARALTILAATTLLFACGDAPPAGGSTRAATPTQVTTQFLAAVQRQDQAVFAELLTEGALAGLTGDDGFQLSRGALESYDVGAESVRGDHAEVAVTTVDEGTEQDLHVLLRDGAAGWRVYGMRVEFGDGSFTIDLEQASSLVDEIGEQLGEQLAEGMQEAFAEAQATWEQGGSLEEIAAVRAAFDALVSVSPEEHEAAWRVDVDGGGRAAVDVLAELVASTGLALATDEHADALSQPVTLALSGVSRVEAVERVAAAVALHPVWPAAHPNAGFGETPAPDPLRFAPGPRPYPAAFAGPFLIAVTGVTEQAPNPTGSLELTARALGLARGVLAFQTEMTEVVHVERARSAADEPLVDEKMRHMTTPEVRAGYYTYAITKDLTGLLRSVEAIESIAGAVTLPLPVRVEAVAWERADETPRELELGTLSATKWGASSAFRLDGEQQALEGVTLRTAPRKADGSPLGVQFNSSNGWGKQVQADLQCPEAPAAIDLKICTAGEVSYAFTLPRVPLEQWAEQPEQMEPLTFSGDAPIAVELVGAIRRDGDQAQVTLKLYNRSNKDATSLVVDFHYLDAAGTELESFWHTLTGDFDFDTGSFGPVIAAGATAAQETQAAFAPPHTAGIRFEPVKVEFPDGTTWEPDN